MSNQAKTDELPPTDSPDASSSDTATRRDFLARSGSLVISACALAGVAGSVGLALPNFHVGLPPRFALGRPADFKIGTLTWLRDRALWTMLSFSIPPKI